MRLHRLLPVLVAGLTALGVVAAPAEAAGALAFAPTSLTFPSQDVGTTSAARTITATNSGDQSVFFNNVATTGNSLDFTIVTDDCIGTTLTPGASCAVSVTFSPVATGTRTANVVYTDNAANSPQSVPITGTGTGTNPPLTINDQFFSCSNGVCDIGAGHNVFINNFFTTTFQASGGTAPYTWSGQAPAGLTLRPSGLLLGAPTVLGSQTFTATVTDASGSQVTGTFSYTVTPQPAPSPPGCQTGRKLKEALSGSSFNGRTPSGTANADESKFSGCGGFSLLSVSVSNVNLPDGSQLWVSLDFNPVGEITISHQSGTMPTYNLGRFGVSRDQIRVFSSLPDAGAFQQILIGGAFS